MRKRLPGGLAGPDLRKPAPPLSRQTFLPRGPVLPRSPGAPAVPPLPCSGRRGMSVKYSPSKPKSPNPTSPPGPGGQRPQYLVPPTVLETQLQTHMARATHSISVSLRPVCTNTHTVQFSTYIHSYPESLTGGQAPRFYVALSFGLSTPPQGHLVIQVWRPAHTYPLSEGRNQCCCVWHSPVSTGMTPTNTAETSSRLSVIIARALPHPYSVLGS